MKRCIISAPKCTGINDLISSTRSALIYLRLMLKTDDDGKVMVTTAGNAFKGCTVLPDDQFIKEWPYL